MSGNWCWSLILPACYCWLSCKDDAIDSKMDVMMSWCQRLRGWGLHVANLQLQTGCSNYQVMRYSPYHRFGANSWWNRRAPWIPILSCSYSCYLGYLLLGVLFETFEEVQLRRKDMQWPTKYAMPFLLTKVQWSIQICLSRWESYVFLEMFEGNAWFLQVGGDVYPVYP